jgi:Transcription factor Pcc1
LLQQWLAWTQILFEVFSVAMHKLIRSFCNAILKHHRSFKATEAKVLRVSVNSFCDMCALVLRTLLEFDDEQQQEQHHDAGGKA